MHRSIVTGGTKGIGHAVAKALLSDGGRVMITGRSQTGVDEAVRSLGASAKDGAAIAGAAVDVRDRAGVDAVVARAVAAFGGLDVLVNNAGVGMFVDVAAMSDADWDSIIATNLTGVFYCSRAAIPAMKQSGGGWIVNIASLAGRNYFPGGAAYCASKAGLVAFSESLMQEVRFDNIRVSVVMPGSVATEFNGAKPSADDGWKLAGDDIAEVISDLLRHPTRSLPSKIEIRPAKPKQK